MERHEKILLAIIIGFVAIWITVAYIYFQSQLPPPLVYDNPNIVIG